MKTAIVTERLLLHPLQLSDSGFIFRLLNTSGWLRNIGDRNIKSEDDAKAYIQKILGNDKYTYYTFKLKESNEVIGLTTLLHRDTQDYPDIGFAMLPQYGKMGYAFEAVQSFLQEVRAHAGFEKIIAITLPDNIPSIRLLEKLGLQYSHNFMEGNEALSLYITNV